MPTVTFSSSTFHPVKVGSAQAMQLSKLGKVRVRSLGVPGRNEWSSFGLSVEPGSVQTIASTRRTGDVLRSIPIFSQHIPDPDINKDELITEIKELKHVVEGCKSRVIAVKLKMMEEPKIMEGRSIVKNRIGIRMINDAARKGLITPGKTILVEYVTGNSDFALAPVAAVMGYELIIVMPCSEKEEKKIMALACGAQLRLTEEPHGPWPLQVMREKVKKICAETIDRYLLDQFDSPLNPEEYYDGVGPEIWNGTQGKVDILVSDIGTGGTIIGLGKFLKEKNPAIKVYGVDYPNGEYEQLLDRKNLKNLIDNNRIPKVLKDCDQFIDKIIAVDTKEANDMVQQLKLKEGLQVGFSSGRAAAAAIKLARLPENEDKNIVVVFPDVGELTLPTDQLEKYRKEIEALPIDTRFCVPMLGYYLYVSMFTYCIILCVLVIIILYF